jgi:hypothetical protein
MWVLRGAMAAPPTDEQASEMHAQGAFELASAAEGRVRQSLRFVILNLVSVLSGEVDVLWLVVGGWWLVVRPPFVEVGFVQSIGDTASASSGCRRLRPRRCRVCRQHAVVWQMCSSGRRNGSDDELLR